MFLFKTIKKVVTNPNVENPIKFQNTQNWQIERIGLSSTPKNISAVAYDPVQGIVALGTNDGTIHFMGKIGVEVVLYLKENIKIKDLHFVINREYLCGLCETIVSGNSQIYLCIWSLKNLRLKLQVRSTKDNCKITCIYSPLGSKYLFVGTSNGVIIPCNLKDKWISSSQITPIEDKEVLCMEIHPTNSYLLLCGHTDGYCSIYDFKSKSKKIFSIPKLFYNVTSLAWFPDSTKESFACSFEDGKVVIWKMQKSEPKIISCFENLGIAKIISWTNEGILTNVEYAFSDWNKVDNDMSILDSEISPTQEEKIISSPNKNSENSEEFSTPNKILNKESSETKIENINQNESSIKEISSQENIQSENENSENTEYESSSLSTVLSPSIKGDAVKSGIYIIKLNKSNDPIVQRLHSCSGNIVIPMEPNNPWKGSKFSTYAGCLTYDKIFYEIDLKQRKQRIVGSTLGKEFKKIFFMNYYENQKENLQPFVSQTMFGGSTSNLSSANLLTLCTLNVENEMNFWIYNPDSGIVSLKDTFFEITNCTPWSSTCLIYVESSKSISFIHLLSGSKINIFESQKENESNTQILKERLITFIFPIQFYEILVIAFSDGSISLLSCKNAEIILKLECILSVSSMEFMLQSNGFILFVGDDTGNLSAFTLQMKPEVKIISSTINKISKLPIQQLKSLSAEGIPSNRGHKFDLPLVMKNCMENDALVFNNANRFGNILLNSKNGYIFIRLILHKNILSNEDDFTFSLQDSDNQDVLFLQISSNDITIGHFCEDKSIFQKCYTYSNQKLNESKENIREITIMLDQKSCIYNLFDNNIEIFKASFPKNQKHFESFIRVTLKLKNGTNDYIQDLKKLKSIVQCSKIYFNLGNLPQDWKKIKENIRIDFSTHSYPTPDSILIGTGEKLNIIKFQNNEFKTIKEQSLIAAQIQTLSLGIVKDILAAVALRTDGQIEIFKLQNLSLERIYCSTFLSPNLIRSHDPPSHLLLIDKERLLVVNKDIFLTCSILSPNESREYFQASLYIEKSLPSKQANLLDGFKKVLKKQYDISKLESIINSPDIQEDYIQMIDIEEKTKSTWSKEVIQEANQLSSNSRFIRNQYNNSAHSIDSLDLDPKTKASIPLRGDSSNVVGEVDDVRALVGELNDKAKLRGEKLQQLNESSVQLLNSAEEFAKKTERLKSKTKIFPF